MDEIHGGGKTHPRPTNYTVDRDKNKNTTNADLSSSTASNLNTGRAMAQYSADARLMAEFEQSGVAGKLFNYKKSVSDAPNKLSTDEQMVVYLSKMQRGALVQPFGCMVAIEEPSFEIIGYSENCFEMLGVKSLLESEGLMGLIGVDARTLFSPSSRDSLVKAVASREISFLNPIWVHSRTTEKPFYAILHRIDVGIIIDLEPAGSGDPAMLHAVAVQSQKLAVRAISRLQSLPGGDIGILCDTIVEDVQKLTGYDRVMVYKFHDDNHGEVVSEIRRSDLEPYLGLHYPATDIPLAARFLFMQNRVRIICDCRAKPAKIIQSKDLKQPLCLVNSTLRSPHGCHNQYMENMGSIASLAMAVIVNTGDSLKLWGLVVCHHALPRHVPFPLRYACEFLMQAFGLQLHMELQLASQLAEKKILRTQTLLCDMLLRDTPSGIVNQSPSIMDLVNCDGAALYHGGKYWLLGVTPSEDQMKDLVEWLLRSLGESTGLSTDSLVNAGYPGAALLGDAVCGMISAKISSSDFLFWFRSHAAKEIKWGGAKHLPEEKDDYGRMHPRSSFDALLEVLESRSLQWEVAEINAIHSLQLILRSSFQDIEGIGHKPEMKQNVLDPKKVDELTSVASEMVRLIETANVPIFGVDLSGWINGWNAKMCELTGLTQSEALGKSLINDIVHEDSHKVFEIFLQRALQGDEDKNVEVKLRNLGTHVTNAVILANACVSRNYKNDIIGVCFIGQDVTTEKTVMDKFIRLQGDYKLIIQSLNPLIPPIFASDENAHCSEWNSAMEKLTGWTRHEIIGKMLPGEIFGNFCQLKGQDALTKFMILLYRAISGHDTEKLPFEFFDRRGEFVEVFLTASKRADVNGNVSGCFCFLQTAIIKQQEPSIDKEEGKRQDVSKLKELTYLRREMKNPLNGIRFAHRLLESSTLSEDQKQILETSDACERQILSIIDDSHFRNLENREVELKMEEFIMGNVINAIVSQCMILVNEKSLRLSLDIPDGIRTLKLCGDQIKLQLALSDLLVSVMDYAPSPGGWVEIKVSPGLKLVQDGNEFVRLQCRMTHPGHGLPCALVEEMLGPKTKCTSEQGFVLNLSHDILRCMNGNTRYIRDPNECYFLIDLGLKSSKSRQCL